MRNRLVTAIIAATLLGSTAAALAQDAWEGLQPVRSRRVDSVHVLPGTDFRTYRRFILDPAEVAFDRNWQRDFNRTVRAGGRRITDADAARMLGEVRDGFNEVFTRTLTRAGYEVVTAPGPDVLRVRAAVVNIRITAPDQPTAGRTQSFSGSAGQATMVLELRDGLTNAVVGRVIDSRTVGDSGTLMLTRNSVTNRADFQRTFQRWADTSLRGLEELRANSPVAPPAK